MVLNIDTVFRCPFCPCVFSSQVDLDLHLKAFGSVPHLCLFRGVHFLLEVDVDGKWHRWYKRYICRFMFRKCLDFLSVSGAKRREQ